jgi:hypothetical protein
MTMQLSVSDKILCEIGRITVYQSHVESELAFFIQESRRIADDGRGTSLL